MLIPCGGCHRHVRATDAACPFCAHPTDGSASAGVVPEPGQRLSRAGVLAFAAAFLSSACQPTSTPAPRPRATDDVGVMQTIYGGPPAPPPMPVPPPATDVPLAAVPDAPPHPPPAPIYGAPPRVVQPGPGSVSTRYGSPPRPDDDLDG